MNSIGLVENEIQVYVNLLKLIRIKKLEPVEYQFFNQLYRFFGTKLLHVNEKRDLKISFLFEVFI